MPENVKPVADIHHELIQKCRDRNRAAQFEVYKLYYRSMYNTCLRIVNNAGEAEDIMQESFLSAFKNIDSYKGEVSFGAWLKKIVINRAIDAVRTKKAIFEELKENLEMVDEEEKAGLDEADQLLLEKVRRTIEELPEGYRIVITLYLIEGYDHEEIAQILNISESSSRSQLVRAKKKLNELLKQK